MSRNLIENYVDELARRLPVDAVDELADGLTQTYRHHLTRTGEPDTAARAAIAEFGEPGEVAAAFTRNSRGLRAARRLLATGPVVGALWATVLITGHAWSWAVPFPVRLSLGAALLTVVLVLLVAATGHAAYLRTRNATTAGSIALLLIDTAAVVFVALFAPALSWPLLAAASASLARIGLTLHTLPRLVTS